jgi:predicted  nucleic acid-binding Zn-ribbon protein
MAQRTEPDLKDLTDLIKRLDKKIDGIGSRIEAIETKVNDLDKKVGIGFSDINGKLDVINSRVATVETGLTKLDNRLWTFGGIALSVTIGSLLTVFARYIFTDTPKL